MSETFTKEQFRVIFCSGEDPQFPLSNLICEIDPGWQSFRFPNYPQILLIQFMNPDILIKNISITAHQAKIPKSIEIFSCALSDIHRETNKINFKKIGEMRFSDNQLNEYKKREVQTAHLDLKSSYLKLILHSNYENPLNPFNQVGLVKLLIKSEKNMENYQKNQEELAFPNINYSYKTLLSSVLDEKSAYKYKSLELEKKEAIRNEDFDKAQSIKTQMDQILFYGPYSMKIQEKTQNALVQEDFDTLKVMKAELQRLQNHFKNEKFLKGGLILRQENQEKELKNAINTCKRTNKTQEGFHKGVLLPNNNSLLIVTTENPEIKAETAKKLNENTKFKALNPETPKRSQETNKMEPFSMSPIKNSHENQLIFPEKTQTNETEAKNIPPPIEEAHDLTYDLHDTLTAEQRALCSPFLGLLGDEICNKLFHEKWQKRELGLLELENRVFQDEDFKKTLRQNNNTLSQIFKLFAIISKDKVIKIVIIALELLKKLLFLDALKDKAFGHEIQHLENLLESLMERIGDNCLKINQNSKEIYWLLAKKAESKAHNPGVLVVLKSLEKENNKNNGSLRHMEERMKLLNELIKNQTNLPESLLTNVAAFLVKNIEHQKNTIRDVASKGLENLKISYGEQNLKKILGDIPRRLENKIFN